MIYVLLSETNDSVNRHTQLLLNRWVLGSSVVQQLTSAFGAVRQQIAGEGMRAVLYLSEICRDAPRYGFSKLQLIEFGANIVAIAVAMPSRVRLDSMGTCHVFNFYNKPTVDKRVWSSLRANRRRRQCHYYAYDH